VGAQIPIDETEQHLFAYKQTTRQGREMELAQVDGTGGLGLRTASGHGDSLLPNGPLWGLKNKHAVRYHEYPGFYEGSQPDRAATESMQQVPPAAPLPPSVSHTQHAWTRGCGVQLACA
jgi:hypothetical protein